MLTALLLCAEVHLHGQDGELRQYVLKREFAEGAIYMTMPQFPAEALLLAQNGPGTFYRFGQLLVEITPHYRPESHRRGLQ